jgi:hypothetical protein
VSKAGDTDEQIACTVPAVAVNMPPEKVCWCNVHNQTGPVEGRMRGRRRRNRGALALLGVPTTKGGRKDRLTIFNHLVFVPDPDASEIDHLIIIL